jgi:hypothetical protein
MAFGAKAKIHLYKGEDGGAADGKDVYLKVLGGIVL